MLHSVHPSSRSRNRVRVWNSEGFESVGFNLVTYQGADVLTALLAGNQAYKLSAFYFEYENTSGSVTAAAAARTDTAATRQAVASPYDLLRAPLAAAPSISSSNGALYAGNQATLFALTSASTGAVNSLPFSAGANSKVYAVCLLATPTPDNLTLDALYARYILGTPVPVTGSGQVSAAWMVEAD